MATKKVASYKERREDDTFALFGSIFRRLAEKKGIFRCTPNEKNSGSINLDPEGTEYFFSDEQLYNAITEYYTDNKYDDVRIE